MTPCEWTARFGVRVGLILALGGCDCDEGGNESESGDGGRCDGGPCGGEDAGDIGDSGLDAGVDSGLDAGADAAPDGGVPCEPGSRPLDDDCNWCTCDGARETCTDRECSQEDNPCTVDGDSYSFGERFDLGCAHCVCAGSGSISCSLEDCEEDFENPGNEWLGSLDEPCGDNPDFTAGTVLAEILGRELVAPFLYDPEGGEHDDTFAHIEVAYDDGFISCVASVNPFLDIEVKVNFWTEDGLLDEGFRVYLRRFDTEFAEYTAFWAQVPEGGLHGSYTHACIQAEGFNFTGQFYDDGLRSGDVVHLCEGDLGFEVGAWETHADQ